MDNNEKLNRVLRLNQVLGSSKVQSLQRLAELTMWVKIHYGTSDPMTVYEITTKLYGLLYDKNGEKRNPDEPVMYVHDFKCTHCGNIDQAICEYLSPDMVDD